MDYSLSAWLGALAGMIAAAALYVPAVGLIDRRLRAQPRPASADERAAFEEKLSLVRRLILGMSVAILATLGYWVGKAIGAAASAAISPPVR
ncbi:MAG: hypothetical protein WBF58_17865 [Xanthobacteraceae bacterium]